MNHNAAPCATRGVPFCYTTSKDTLTIPCFSVNTVSQYAAWIARNVLMRTQGIFGPTLCPAKVFMDTASTSSLPSFLLTCKVAGLSAKWTTGELPVDNSLVSERTAPMVARLDSEGANQSTCRCVSLILASQCTDELDEVRKDSRNTHTHALMS